MKKLVFIIIVLLISNFSFSNPVPEPPVITEIYFENGQIYIEVYFHDYYYEYYELTNLDNLNLVSNNGYVEFVEGIDIEYNEVMVLSSSDLMDPFVFNPEGDNIYMATDDGWELGFDHFRYGNEPYSDVMAPQAGQSIAILGQYDFYYNMYLYVGKGIEEPHTIGSNPWSVNTRGSIEGWIYDSNNDPIQGLQVFDVYTDESGYFLKSDLLCNIKNYIHVLHYGNYLYTFSDTIFPNQTSQQIIHLDTILTSIPEYYNFPNPIVNMTWFSIDIPTEISFDQAYLGIYSIAGRLVEKINLTNHVSEINWDATKLNSGVYLYNIVLDDKPFLTKKMIIQ